MGDLDFNQVGSLITAVTGLISALTGLLVALRGGSAGESHAPPEATTTANRPSSSPRRKRLARALVACGLLLSLVGITWRHLVAPPPGPIEGVHAATPTPHTPTRRYPIALLAGAGAQVKAAHALYEVLAAQLDQFSDGRLSLKFTMRFTNDGNAFSDRTVMAENFRLLVDGVLLAPTESLNETVATGSAKEGAVVFVIPANAKSVVLRVGRMEYGTASIPVDLKAAGA